MTGTIPVMTGTIPVNYVKNGENMSKKVEKKSSKMERMEIRIPKELKAKLEQKKGEISQEFGIKYSMVAIVRKILEDNVENFSISMKSTGTIPVMTGTIPVNIPEEKTGISGKANIEPESQKKSIWAETIEEIVDKVPLSEIEINSIRQLRRDYETSTGPEQGQVIAYMDELIEEINYNAFKEVGK